MELLELCTFGSVFESACLIRFSEFGYVVITDNTCPFVMSVPVVCSLLGCAMDFKI